MMINYHFVNAINMKNNIYLAVFNTVGWHVMIVYIKLRVVIDKVYFKMVPLYHPCIHKDSLANTIHSFPTF